MSAQNIRREDGRLVRKIGSWGEVRLHRWNGFVAMIWWSGDEQRDAHVYSQADAEAIGAFAAEQVKDNAA